MPSNYKANDPYVNEQVDLDDVFVSDAWLVDQFVGGTLFGWGANSKGAIGNETTTKLSSPIQVGSLTNWKQISCSYFTSAVKTDGTLWTWGYNQFGALGNDTSFNSYSSPIQVGSLTNWKQVSNRYYHFMAIKTDGTLWGCGYNSFGGLGNGTTIHYSSPIQVGLLRNWKQVSVAGRSTAAIKNDGTLWTCGDNRWGELGNGTIGVYYSSPIQIGSLTNWKQVSFGGSNIAAIKTDGTLWACGYNYWCALGYTVPIYGTSTTSGNFYGSATWANTDPDTTILYQGGAGSYTNFWIGSNGSLWAAGFNDKGQLGNGTQGISYSSPIQIGSLTNWRQVSSSFYANLGRQTAATKTDGTLWTWGFGGNGALGNGTVNVDYSSPIQIGSLTTWKQVCTGSGFCVSVKTDGTLWSWGSNNYGQLGNNSFNNYSSPIQIGSLTTWSKVSCGYGFTAAIKTDGTLWTWGGDVNISLGYLGNGTVNTYSSPIQVGNNTNWKQVSCGMYNALAVKTDGTLWAWGRGDNGRLGNGTTISYSSPIQIGSLTTWKQVASSSSRGNAIKTDGTFWRWGDDGYGSTGSSPVQVGTATNWVQLNCGYTSTFAYASDNTLYGDGRNHYGQIGVPTSLFGNSSSPQQVGSLTNWKQVSISSINGAAIKTDGTLWVWGYGAGAGALGNGTEAIVYSSPIQIGSLTNWKQVSCGYTMAATKTDGTLWAWGRNNPNGWIGNGTTIHYSSPIQIGSLTNWKQIDTSMGSHSVSAITFKDIG